MFGLILALSVDKDSPFANWEQKNLGSIFTKLAGFVFLVCGSFIYNEIIILPFARPPPKGKINLNIYSFIYSYN